MEQIARIAGQVLTSSDSLLNEEPQEKREISLYGQGKVTARCLALNIAKLKRAFPKLPEGWYLILEEMLDIERFTDKRLDDAVSNLIRTSIYPEPTIANLISFDKKSKVWTYQELLEQTKDYSTERRKDFWNKMEIIDKENKLWRLK